MTGTLTPDAVNDLIRACLIEDKVLEQKTRDAIAADEDLPDEVVLCEGVVAGFVFNKASLEAKRPDITALFQELPDEFFSADEGGGGGWSFMNGCTDRHGNLWTGNQAEVEAFFCLGIGLGIVKEQLPREMWHVLPGGVPYYVVTV